MRGILGLLRPESLLLQQRIKSKKKALEALSESLSAGIPSTEPRTLLELLTEREQLGSTGLGQGVAIPHCRVPGAERDSAAILTLTEGIDFGSIDGKPVDVFVALAVPDEATEIHLQYLKELAEIISVPEQLTALRTCRTAEPLLATLAEA